MVYGRNKRSYNRAFGAIASSSFYGKHKKPVSFKRHKTAAVAKGTTKRRGSTSSVTKTVNTQNDSYGGGAISYCKIKFGPKLKAPKGTAPILVHSNSEVSAVANTGQQQFIVPAASATRSSWQAWESICANNLKATVGNAASTAIVNVKVWCRYITQEHRFYNATIRPIMLEIYDYKYKKSSPDSVSTMLTNASSADNTGDLTTGNWQNSVRTFPGWQPQDSSVINQYIKIVKRRKIFLQAGESHIHVINVQYNKSFNPGFTGTTTQVQQFQGFTFGCFARIIGGMSGGSTSGYDIGSCEAYCFTIERASIRGISQSLPQTQQYQGVTTLSGTEQFVDEVKGGIVKSGVGELVGQIIL